MAYPRAPMGTVVSLRRHVKINDVVIRQGETLADFLSKFPGITVLDILPTGRRVIIDGSQPALDFLKHHWGSQLHFVPRTIGILHTAE